MHELNAGLQEKVDEARRKLEERIYEQENVQRRRMEEQIRTLQKERHA